MGFLLIYETLWLEIGLLFLGIIYMIFHMGHGFWSKFLNFRSLKVFYKKERTKILRKHTIEQKKVDTQVRRSDVSLTSTKKRLTAREKIALENVFKSVQAKLAVQDYTEARLHIIEGLMIDRHHQELNVLLAQLYEKEEDYEKAEILFRDLILHHDPKKADLYIYLGNNLVAQKKQSLAYDVFKKGLEKETKNIELLQTLSELGYELHEYEESLLYSRRLTELQPKHIRGHEILALSHLQVGADQKAYDTFLTLRKLDPYSQIVLAWLPKVEEKLGVHSETKNFLVR